jgi:hypothetical protein
MQAIVKDGKPVYKLKKNELAAIGKVIYTLGLLWQIGYEFPGPDNGPPKLIRDLDRIHADLSKRGGDFDQMTFDDLEAKPDE